MEGKATCKLLVVDDDKTILNLFATALELEGYAVSTAASGREGLRMATEDRFDVALLDIDLPDICGIEVMRQLVKTTDTIVILVTGNTVDYSHESVIREGAADFIAKPVRIAELAMRIKQARDARTLAVAYSSRRYIAG